MDNIKKNMQQVLLELDQILGESSAVVVLDSGTLLGLYRDGGFLDLDHEIDISTTDSGCLKRIAKTLKDKGMTYHCWYYCGKPYKFEFSIFLGPMKIAVDLKLFTDEKELWSCPAIGIRSENSKSDSQMVYIANLKKFIKSNIDFGRFPFNQIVFHDSWVVPKNYFNDKKILEGYSNIEVPKDIEAYLSYRYSNWKTKKSDWVSHKDDGGFRKSL